MTTAEIAPVVYLTLQEVSKILYVQPRVVGTYIAEQGLRASRIGKRLLVSRNDLDKFIASRAV